MRQERFSDRPAAQRKDEPLRELLPDGEPLAWVALWTTKSSSHKGLPETGRDHLFDC